MHMAMHRHTLSETGGMASTRSSRTPSFSSDRPSVASSVTFQMPSTVRPPPAYIAASVASQTVTDHHNAQLRDHDDVEADELQNAVFSELALALLNAFLDHLLFAFLSSARSPSLTAIRPAISHVLKPRLAREAMEAADEELQGLLAEDDDEDLPAHDANALDNWDVDKVWKRTRLRIMVYTRLGELEDEDEERYVQQERGLSMDVDDDEEAGLVSWASAIFLTSVVEYVAEQTLLISGSAAYARMAAKMKKLALQLDDKEEQSIERLIIEEPDVEKIALNSALGRLWRTWRKRVRSPQSPLSPGRGLHSLSSYSSLHHRKSSRDTVETLRSEHDPLPEHLPTETDIAANIPLPLGDNDVNEIEVPGLAPTYEEVERSDMETPIPRAQRPSSVLMLSQTETLRRTNKERPMSMPLRPAPLFTVPAPSSDELEQPSESPVDGMSHDEVSSDEEHSGTLQEPTLAEEQLQESPEPDASMVAFAAATGMGFRMSTVDPVPSTELEGEKEPEIPSAGGYEGKPMVMRSKRMSIERTGPPGIVRTFSTRSSSLKSPQHTPVATPKASAYDEGRSYLNDDASDEELDQHTSIGIARTSDHPIRSTSTTPSESPYDKGKGPGHGGYVEVQPRSTAPAVALFRNTPSPDAKPIVPERSIARKEANRRSLTGSDYASSPTQYEGPTSAPRRNDAPRSASRGGSLPALHEVDTNTTERKASGSSEYPAHRSSPTSISSRHSPTYANRDGPIYVPERRAPRLSTDGSIRSQPAPTDRSPSDKTSLKRGASSASSVKKQGSFAVASSGRDSGASHRSRNLSGRMSEEDREREFDSLVKGKETVKFTLTPQNMRDLDESPVQKKVEPSRSSQSSVTVQPRANADDGQFGASSRANATSPRARGPTAVQHKPSPSRKVITRPLARDPKIETESMRDFADFIRSTGPSPGQEKPVQKFNLSGNGLQSNNNSTSSLGRKISTNQSSSGGLNGQSAKARVNMEPRSPAGLSSGNDDLIDFIRQGPPNANNGQPRIPRNVAPFRTTVDSDQFDNMLGDHGNVESAYGSTSSTLDSTQTVNSRTGLIPSPSVVQPAYSNTPQQLSGSMSASNAEPMITRTRRRVKDPYAIDLSDEDDDEDDDQLTALPHSSQPQAPAPRQESLMDFLNGMEPPSTSKPQPFMLSEETIAAARTRATSSNPSLTSSNSTTRNNNNNNNNNNNYSNGNGSAPPFGTISSSSIASDANRSYKPRLQARAPAVADPRSNGGSKTNTSDLADFLRNSGPPEPVAPPVNRGEEKKSKRFWRRGKTYGDLP